MQSQRPAEQNPLRHMLSQRVFVEFDILGFFIRYGLKTYLAISVEDVYCGVTAVAGGLHANT